MKLLKALPLALFTLAFPALAASTANTTNDSFNKAKKMLEREVYQDNRVTAYCGAKFGSKKNITAPTGLPPPPNMSNVQRRLNGNMSYWLRTLAELSLSDVKVMLSALTAKVSHSMAVSAQRRLTKSIDTCRPTCTTYTPR